jgi:hypothetical protein
LKTLLSFATPFSPARARPPHTLPALGVSGWSGSHAGSASETVAMGQFEEEEEEEEEEEAEEEEVVVDR